MGTDKTTNVSRRNYAMARLDLTLTKIASCQSVLAYEVTETKPQSKILIYMTGLTKSKKESAIRAITELRTFAKTKTFEII
jgi:hypothetical protein